jgi:hypothetical protein
MATYSINVDSCEARPKIVATFEDVPEEELENALSVAIQSFRSVEVINNETGEVVLNHYEGLRLHNQVFEYGTALDVMKRICYKEEE